MATEPQEFLQLLFTEILPGEGYASADRPVSGPIETDSEIRVIWRSDDGNEIQKLSGSHAEALETLVLRIAEEAYATSNLETE